MVLFLIAFAARQIASASEHSAVGRSQLREIDFVPFSLGLKRAASGVGETLLTPREYWADSSHALPNVRRNPIAS